MKTKSAGMIMIAVLCILPPIGAVQAQQPTYTVIHNFASYPNGAAPYAPLIRDANGDFYGTTTQGGGAGNAGVVFKLDLAGYQKVVYTFTGGADGGNPYSGLAADSAGNFYGTTFQGGLAGAGPKELGAGAVYKIDPTGQYTVLYTFTGGADGSGPYAGVILDASGNLYGTTYNGGKDDAGVVYELTPTGQETVLYSFRGRNDGANPYGGLTFGPDGDLYGGTVNGGYGELGVLYKVNLSGKETVIHTFNASIGNRTFASVIFDAEGNMYGTTADTVYELDAAGHYKLLARLQVNTSCSSALVQDAAGNFYGAAGVAGGVSDIVSGAVFELDTSRKVHWLYKFPGLPPGGPGSIPGVNPSVILGPAGEIYGATAYAGTAGMVYEIDAHRKEKALYSFPAARGGTRPWSGVIRDAAGNLYGTTQHGGSANEGVVFKIDPAGRETALHAFTGGADGARPQASVVRDSAGNIYGTTVAGGPADAGVMFKLDPSGAETILYSFTGGADGGYPNGLVLDPAGNLYGTTAFGGSGSLTGVQEGLVFKLDPAGNYTLLHSFTGLSDGGIPEAGLVRDTAGNLYGTTYGGGSGGGVIYEIDAAGQYSVLHTFDAPTDGGSPYAGLTLDEAGNLYGTTAAYGPGGGGTVFELDTAGNYTVLYAFGAFASGGLPLSGLARDTAGNLYGTTYTGGASGCGYLSGCGVVFEVDASGNETVLHTFTGGADGGQSVSGVVLDKAGNLYGAASAGGTGGGGVAFKLALGSVDAAEPSDARVLPSSASSPSARP